MTEIYLMHYCIKFVFISIICSMFFSTPSVADDLSLITGKWVSTTAGSGLGEPVIFAKAYAGWDATIPGIGLSAITISDGTAGSHIKVEGPKELACYYYVTILGAAEMTWALRRGGDDCPKSAVFRKEFLPEDSVIESEKLKVELLGKIGSDINIDYFQQKVGTPERVAVSKELKIRINVYSGPYYNTYLAINNDKIPIGVAVSPVTYDKLNNVPIPVLVLLDSSAADGSGRFLGKSNLDRLSDSDGVLLTEVDARYGFFLIKQYYGRPGKYLNYYFGFNAFIEKCKYKPFWPAGFKLSDIKCNELHKSKPIYAFVGFGILDEEQESALAKGIVEYVFWGNLD